MAVGEARLPLLHEERTAHHGIDVSAVTSRAPLSSLSHTVAVVTSLVAGAAAGALAKSAIAPLDRTKIKFQTSQTPYSARAAIDFIRHTARAEGVAALWRGNSATMARIVPYAAVQFTAHEQWKRLLGVDTPSSAQAHPLRHLLAGSLAGVTSQSVTYPLDLARARMAVTDASVYRTLSSVFSKVTKEEGFRTLYRGYVATVLGVIPYAGVSFFTYDSLKHKYLEHTGAMPSGTVNVMFGGAAGALGQTASYPLDIVRRRMQTAPLCAETGTYMYSSILTTLRLVYASEGWRGFFKGLSMNWVKGPISVGISFATYDSIKTNLREMALRLQSS